MPEILFKAGFVDVFKPSSPGMSAKTLFYKFGTCKLMDPVIEPKVFKSMFGMPL